MNAILQQLFHTPAFLTGALHFTFEESSHVAVQRLFTEMNNSSVRFVASPCCRNREWLSETLTREVEVIEIYSIKF
jgi:hypothetical protein